MTALTFVVPYTRASPVHIPRRDLVLASSDNLALRVSIIERDTPDSPALVLTGGMGGPALRLVVWNDSVGNWWDYGSPHPTPGAVLGSFPGVISDAVGSFDVTIPQGTLSQWPLRCGFGIFLDWNGGASSEMLAGGTLNVRLVQGGPVATPEVITTDSLEPITTD